MSPEPMSAERSPRVKLADATRFDFTVATDFNEPATGHLVISRLSSDGWHASVQPAPNWATLSLDNTETAPWGRWRAYERWTGKHVDPAVFPTANAALAAALSTP